MRQIQIRFGRYQFGQNPNRASLFVRVKDCEIIADNLSNAVGAWVTCQPLILRGERSGLLTPIVGTESVLLCDDLMWDSQNFPRVLVRLDVF
jgi:hypothetical protein